MTVSMKFRMTARIIARTAGMTARIKVRNMVRKMVRMKPFKGRGVFLPIFSSDRSSRNALVRPSVCPSVRYKVL